jgi:hypothetical protein
MEAKNVNQVLQLIVSALWGGYTISNVLKWYWWRFNGYGYFWGMFVGMIVAGLPLIPGVNLLEILFPGFSPDIRVLYYFPVILVTSTIGCIISTYMTSPTDEETLKDFYKKVRPWGFWKPIHNLVVAENPHFNKNTNFKMDMLNVVIGTIWQTAIVAFPMYLVFHEFSAAAITLLIVAVFTFILKKTWYDNLENH